MTKKSDSQQHNRKGKFEKRFVAFIDILGFKEHVNNDPESLQTLIDILYEIRDLQSDFDIQYKSRDDGSGGGVYPYLDIISFSDNIIITAPLEHIKIENGLESLYHQVIFVKFLVTISELYKKFLQHRIALRGAVSIGDVYYDHEKNIIVGSIIEAIDAESKIAIYPRVIICNSLLNFFNQSNHKWIGYYQFFRRDFDGIYFARDGV